MCFHLTPLYLSTKNWQEDLRKNSKQFCSISDFFGNLNSCFDPSYPFYYKFGRQKLWIVEEAFLFHNKAVETPLKQRWISQYFQSILFYTDIWKITCLILLLLQASIFIFFFVTLFSMTLIVDCARSSKAVIANYVQLVKHIEIGLLCFQKCRY